MKPEAAPGGHLGAEDFYGFIEKTLDRARLREVEAHLAGCPECVQDLAVVLAADEPGLAEEEAALATLPGGNPAEALEKLKGQIIASAPGPEARSRGAWRRLLAPAAALAFAAVLIVVGNAWVLKPARGRSLARRAFADLVRAHQSTGRLPVRYIRGFETARVTRSSFDTETGEDQSIHDRLVRAIALAPKAVEPRLALGLFELDRGAVDGAEKELRAALEFDPRSVDARNGLAVVCYLRHQTERSETWLREGLEHLTSAERESPDDPQVRYNFGMFYMAMGRRAEALAAFRRYVTADPASEWGRMAKEYVAELEAAEEKKLP